MNRLVIVGGERYGREIRDIVVAMGACGMATWQSFLGCVDHDETGGPPLHLRIGGLSDDGMGADLGELGYSIGLEGGDARRAVAGLLAASGMTPVTLIHPAASMGSDNRLSDGCVLAAGARVTTNVTMGRHVHLHPNATVGHDSVLGDYVTVHAGATVSGNVEIGEATVIGAGANLLPGIRVGSDAQVDAGTVVLGDVPNRARVRGVPARPARRSRPSSASGHEGPGSGR